jgi:hypothetical protein
MEMAFSLSFLVAKVEPLCHQVQGVGAPIASDHSCSRPLACKVHQRRLEVGIAIRAGAFYSLAPCPEGRWAIGGRLESWALCPCMCYVVMSSLLSGPKGNILEVPSLAVPRASLILS